MNLCPESARADDPLGFVAVLGVSAVLALYPTYFAVSMVRRRRYVYTRDGRAIEGKKALIIGAAALVTLGALDLIVAWAAGCVLYMR